MYRYLFSIVKALVKERTIIHIDVFVAILPCEVFLVDAMW